MNEILIMDKQNVINHDWSSSNLWIFWNVFNRNQGHDETEHRMEVERFILCIVAETVIGWQSKIVNWNIREGLKKTGIFPLGGEPSFFTFFPVSKINIKTCSESCKNVKNFFLYLVTPPSKELFKQTFMSQCCFVRLKISKSWRNINDHSISHRCVDAKSKSEHKIWKCEYLW